MTHSTIKFSQIEDRLDAEYYKPEFLIYSSPKSNFSNLGQYISIKNGFPFSSSLFGIGKIPFIRIRDFSEEGINFSNVSFLPEKYFDNCNIALPVRSDIILGMDGNDFRAAFIESKQKIAINQRVAIIKSKKITPELVYVLLNSRFGQDYFNRYFTTAGVVGHISNTIIKKLPVYSIFLKNQKQIADIVQKSFQKRQLAKQKYQQAQDLLEKFLKIDKQKLDFEKCFSLSFSKIEDRIDGEYYQSLSLLKLLMFKQGSVPLGELVKISTGKTPAKQSYAKKGIKILKARDLTNKGINWENIERAYIKLETWQKIKKAQLKKDDLLLISAAHQAYYIGQNIDIVFDVPEKFNNKLSTVAELLIIRSEKINPYILLWYLRTKIGYLLIQRLITGETSHLYPKDLINLPIPKILLKFKDAEKVEKLTKQSLLLQKESKELLERTKQKVEKLIK